MQRVRAGIEAADPVSLAGLTTASESRSEVVTIAQQAGRHHPAANRNRRHVVQQPITGRRNAGHF